MIWRVALWVVAVAAALVPLPASLVEQVYARRLFPILQHVLTTLSNQVPFALFDVIVVGVIGACLLAALRGVADWRRSGWLRALARAGARLVTFGAIAYLVFLATWGMNYRRPSLATQLSFDPRRITPDAAVRLAEATVHEVDDLYTAAHREAPVSGTIDGALADAFSRAQHGLGSDAPFIVGRPKRTLLDGYFRRAGVAGMTDPYFLETLVASDLLQVERPMVIAHEWSHLAGIADEGDANFAGWLTCMRGSALHQYSGWLFLYGELIQALPSTDAQRVAAALSEGPRADLEAIRTRLLLHVSPAVSAAGWRVYDQYLKANRVEAGTASYAQVVRLVLGTDFAPDWTPRLRRNGN